MSDLDDALASLDWRSDDGAWQPRLFDATNEEARVELAALVRSPAVLFARDELAAQIAELIEVRAPERKFTVAELKTATEAFLQGRSAREYGTWVYYPWSRKLIHVLPRAEYVEVRTSRNRNKITAPEQAKLGALTVGVAGLSVGQSTAITLALEGIGGRFRLADFDTINLSNLNRLRAGAHTIGINKAVVTARELFELDPYAHVELYPRGVEEDSLDRFIVGLDLLFEECDDLKMKVRLRETARKHRVPVLMETSDRGLFDLERFDLEPERPLFHGLTGDLRAESLVGLSTFEKVPVVLRIVGEETMSTRMAASLVDIEATIKSWPQLASAVALGGAVNADVARRVALGEMTTSGRFFVDLSELVSDGRAFDVSGPPPPLSRPSPTREAATVLLRGRGAHPTDAEVEQLVEYAALAPSGGNTQPFQFRWHDGALVGRIDESRPTLLDFGGTASQLALGAATENVVLAAGALGYAATVELASKGVHVRFRRNDAPADPLAAHIAARATNRKLGANNPLVDEERRALAASASPAQLTLLEDRARMGELATVLGEGDRVRYLNRTLHREMMEELRWSADEAERTRDGIDVASLDLSPTDLCGLRLVSRWPIMDTLGRTGGGAGLTKATHKAVAASSALGLLTLRDTGGERFIIGGRAMQRMWLTATSLDLAFQPMTALLYLLARVEQNVDLGDLSATDVTTLRLLGPRLRALFPDAGPTELMLFRLGRGAAPKIRSLRRHAASFLVGK